MAVVATVGHFFELQRKNDPASAYYQDLKIAGKSEKTIMERRSDLRSLEQALRKPILGLTADDLRAYFQAIEGLSQGTRSRRFSTFRGFYSWAVQQGLIESNPMDRLPNLKQGKRLPRPIAPTQVQAFKRVLKEASADRRLLFLLMLQGGLRISEARSLRVKDFRLQEGDETVYVHGKGSKDREVPLFHVPALVKEIRAYVSGKEGSAYLFTVQGSDSPISYPTAHRAWSALCKEAGIDTDEATIHSLRHTFASDFVKKGVDLGVISKVLGHEKLETTMIYAEVNKRVIKEELTRKLQKKKKPSA